MTRLSQLGGFATPLLERAIGVIYRPQTNRTTALVPLEPSPHWYREEVPETYPSGL